MAIRNVRIEGDDILRKKSREITVINRRLTTLIKDMKDTMYEENGVGLAAPQVGILKRVIVIDVGEGAFAAINPEIIDFSGEQTDVEGCLSVPGKEGRVTRPNYVKVKGLNEKGEDTIWEGEELLARAFCHEIDHLNGILFIDKILKDEDDE
ncbi:MAG: peptide deformylase [Clostridiaceae bacterium]